jgi:hypothetical protein
MCPLTRIVELKRLTQFANPFLTAGASYLLAISPPVLSIDKQRRGQVSIKDKEIFENHRKVHAVNALRSSINF